MFTWTPKNSDRLKALWLSGMPTAAIGDEMGCGRSAATNRARRMGLPGRLSPFREDPRMWTQERIETLTRLWVDGATTPDIGKALGIGKHAVIGKAHRLGLPGRPSPIKPRPVLAEVPKALKCGQPSFAPAFLVTQPPKDWEEEAELVAVAPPPVVAFAPPVVGAARECQFIEGDPRELLFCGAPAVRKSYCEIHWARCYRPVTRADGLVSA
jgi:GcrA cell cycle regulator